jgi:hypothetical protein
MNKRLIWALGILAASVLVLIFNRGSVTVDLPFVEASISGMKAVVFFAFIGIGVAVGLLLK